jgi:hydroxyacylglutathione hydrolase
MEPMILKKFSLGPIENNTYLAADPASRTAVIIDPSFDPDPILAFLENERLSLEAVWLTHAHFDHIAGVNRLISASSHELIIALHPDDLPLWHEDGGARLFGFKFHCEATPSLLLTHGQQLKLGEIGVEVRHTPGHSPGHVIYYLPTQGLAFTGDLIFYRSVGRTDLPGANPQQLAMSIKTKVYDLPPDTRLLPGHGPETTVGDEVRENPFV